MTRHRFALLLLLVFLGLRRDALAIPLFARQMGLDCKDCHTVWPRLNTDGRFFKAAGYVQTSPFGDRSMPFALRLRLNAESNTSAAFASPSVTVREITVPQQVYLYFGGALIENQLGVFSTVAGERDGLGNNTFDVSLDQMKLSYNISLEHPASVTLMKSYIFGADPFPSLGGLDRLPVTNTDAFVPSFFQNGFLLSTFDTNNYGLLVHGYFGKENRWYGAIGMQTGSLIPDAAAGTNRLSQESLKGYVRGAYEGPLGDGGSYNLGGAFFAGRQNAVLPEGSPYSGEVNRLFVDGAVQLPTNKRRDIFEVVGLYCHGMDHHVLQFDPVNGLSGPNDQKVNGFYAQTDYYFDRKLGPLISFDNTTLGDVTTKSLGVGVTWVPTDDLKVTVSGLFSHGSDGSKNRLLGIYLVKYFYKTPLPQNKKPKDTMPTDAPKPPGNDSQLNTWLSL